MRDGGLRLRLLPIAAIGFLSLLVGCRQPGDRVERRPAPGPRVVLISIDTCRADHLSCYGYPDTTTPNLDRLARDGARFSNAYTPAPITRPAHSTMLTSLLPPVHRVRDNAGDRLPDAAVTLAEILGSHGLTTAAFISAFVLDSTFGLDQGFALYDDDFDEPVMELGVLTRLGEDTSAEAVDWLAQHGDEPFFLFLHYWDPHVDYRPPEPFASRFATSPYAGEIAYTDHCIGQVIEELRDLGLYEKCAIVVTSDHGELLGEHGEYNHGFFIYRNALHVPLIIKPPFAMSELVVDATVGLLDIVPTICGLLGFDAPLAAQGRDLSPVLAGGVVDLTEGEVYCESVWPMKYGASALLGMVTGGWQYIAAPSPELYDLAADPAQQHNLVDLETERAADLRNRLEAIMEAVPAVRLEAPGSGLDGVARQGLRVLGYLVDSDAGDPLGIDSQAADPKDLIDFHTASCGVLTLISEERYGEARSVLEGLIEERPDSPQAYLDLAWVGMSEEDHAGAIPNLETFIGLRPGSAIAHIYLGTCLSRIGLAEPAIAAFRAAVGLAPDDVDAVKGLAAALAKTGDTEETAAWYRRAMELAPGDVSLCNQFGLFLTDRGETERAVDAFKAGLAADDSRPELHFNLARAFREQGRFDEAIHELRAVAAINPALPAVHEALADVLYQEGEVGEALVHWNFVLELAPESPPVLNSVAWLLATGAESDPKEVARAVALAHRACELTQFGSPSYLDTLATAYARSGEIEMAIETGTAAASLARKSGDDELADRIEMRVAEYRGMAS